MSVPAGPVPIGLLAVAIRSPGYLRRVTQLFCAVSQDLRQNRKPLQTLIHGYLQQSYPGAYFGIPVPIRRRSQHTTIHWLFTALGPCLLCRWQTNTMAMKRSDPRNELQLRKQLKMVSCEVFAEVTGRHSGRESAERGFSAQPACP